jgi:hypothetical protein
MTRTGKIARLPYWLRSQLNEKIRDGKPGVEIVAWLNEKPDTRAVVNERFDGRPINEQNLTDWKAGGYLEWERQAETKDWVRDFVGGSRELEREADKAKDYTSVADWLAAPLAVQLARCLKEVAESTNLEVLDRVGAVLEISRAAAQLRRSDLATQRQTREFALEDERISDLGFEDAKKQADEEFHETLANGVFKNYIEAKKAELERREAALKKRKAAKEAREAAGQAAAGKEKEPAEAAGESGQIKVNQPCGASASRETATASPEAPVPPSEDDPACATPWENGPARFGSGDRKVDVP